MSRPELSASLSASDFLDFYWLKNELVAFCQANHLPTSGSKAHITQTIAHFLDTGDVLRSIPKKRRTRPTMPQAFTRTTVISEGWRCSQKLRHFFAQEIGATFHFNEFLRDYITQSGVGHTLNEAIEGWYASKQQPKGTSEIGPQFEYNRHMREFYEQNPGSTRADAIQAWKERRSKRKSVVK